MSVVEHEKQSWAQDMHDLLIWMTSATDYWRELGAKALPEQDTWVALSFHILATGEAFHPPPKSEDRASRKGKPKQSASKNLKALLVTSFTDSMLNSQKGQAHANVRGACAQFKRAKTSW